MSLPPLKSLYYFSVVAEQQSIKAAAEKLFVTQAAVSQQIKSLEAFLGLSVFTREHRALVLTREGQQLLPFLSQAFATIETGINGLREDANPNVLTISVLPSFASRWLIPRLQGFYGQYPELKINLSMTEALDDFSDDNLDVAIRFTQKISDALIYKPLMREYIYPVCHHDYLGQKPLNRIDDIYTERLIDDVDVFGLITWEYWLSQLGGDIRSAKYCQRYDGSHYVVDAALSKQGIAMVRHSLAAESIKQGNLKRLFKTLEGSVVEAKQQFYLCGPEHHFLRPKVQLFCDWLQQQAEDFFRDNSL